MTVREVRFIDSLGVTFASNVLAHAGALFHSETQIMVERNGILVSRSHL
jgi:hypothetical protein